MGIPVLILGASGSGKSTSMRNFDPDQIGIFNVAGKPLPFRKNLPKADNTGYAQIMAALSKPKLKTYVIDDSQYLMSFESFDRVNETGYTKFTDIAVHFRNLVDMVVKATPADCIVYFLHHTEITDTGTIKAKTIGKMLDSQLTLEGLFSIVLLCKRDKDGHHFITESDGYTPAKAPIEMFEPVIDNDLAMVDKTIRNYWNLGGKK